METIMLVAKTLEERSRASHCMIEEPILRDFANVRVRVEVVLGIFEILTRAGKCCKNQFHHSIDSVSVDIPWEG